MAGKKYNDATRRYDRSMMHDPEQGVELVKSLASAKFDESVEVAIRLGAVEEMAGRLLALEEAFREVGGRTPPHQAGDSLSETGREG